MKARPLTLHQTSAAVQLALSNLALLHPKDFARLRAEAIAEFQSATQKDRREQRAVAEMNRRKQIA